MGQADCRLNIYRVYAWVWRIADQILIRCMQGSGGLLTEYLLGVCRGSGGLQTEYSFGVCKGQADYQPNIHSVYAWVRRIADQILIGCMPGIRRIADRIFIGRMQGSGGLQTEYSFGVCKGQADC